MKIKFSSLLLLLIFIGCSEEYAVTFEPYYISSEDCENCANVSIAIPKALAQTKLSEAINIALREELIALLNFDEESDAQTIEEAVNAFAKEYRNLNEKFPEESMPWEANIKGDLTYENEQLLTIKLESYLFTGGAHGYSTIRFLNFDKLQSKELEQQELFNNLEKFENFAEVAFRKQENIALDTPINSTGFMFEAEHFTLPENIGYTEEGILLFYEPYEIASYADGAILLTLPFKDVNTFLKIPAQP